MTSLDSFLPYLSADAMDMPNSLIKRHLLDAAIDFAASAGVVREDIEVNANAGTTSLTVTPLSTLETVEGIISVKKNGSVITYKNYDNNIMLSNAITEDAVITVETYTKPKYGVTEINDRLVNYMDGVVAGALYRIKKSGGGSWTDLNGAILHKQLFDKEISSAKYDMITEKSTKTFSLNPVRFI